MKILAITPVNSGAVRNKAVASLKGKFCKLQTLPMFARALKSVWKKCTYTFSGKLRTGAPTKDRVTEKKKTEYMPAMKRTSPTAMCFRCLTIDP